VDPPDAPFGRKLGHGVERHEPVRVLVGKGDVEAAVHRLVFARGKRPRAAELVPQPALRTDRGQTVGVPLRHAAGLGDQGEQRGREVGHRRRRRDAVEAAGHLAPRLARELVEQHVDGALGARLLREPVPPEAPWEVTLLVRRTELATSHERLGEAGHPRQRLPHARDVDGRRRDERPLGGADAGVLLVHGCERGDFEPVGGCARKTRTRQPVATGAEGGPGDEEIGLLHFEQGEQLGQGVLLVLAEVVVAAGKRHHDFDSVQLGGQAATRADRAFEPGGRRLGCLLAAQAGKELVEVVDRSHHVVAVRACWPVWFVAPR
jgi:hypothetical protein